MTRKVLAKMLTEAGFPTDPDYIWFNRGHLYHDLPQTQGETKDGWDIYSPLTLKEINMRKQCGYEIKFEVERHGKFAKPQIWIS